MANKIPLAYADVELQLSTAIAATDTTFSLTSATDDDGNALPAGKYCFTVDNGTSNKEYLLGQLNGTDVTSVVSVSRQGAESSGAARAHRIGATVLLTDFASIQRVADILRGQETLDSANPIYYDGDPTISSNAMLATKKYVDDNVTGGTITTDKITITGNAGETVADGDWVYLKASDQEWYKMDASVITEVSGVKVGIAEGAGSDGAGITGGIQLAGSYTTTGLTAGAVYFATDTPGVISTTGGTYPRRVGIALSTTVLFVDANNSEWAERGVTTETSSATPTINTDISKVHRLTAQAVNITSVTTNLSGNPGLWDTFVLEIVEASAGDLTIAWGASFSDGDVYNLPTSITASTTLKVFFNWNGSTWSIIGYA